MAVLALLLVVLESAPALLMVEAAEVILPTAVGLIEIVTVVLAPISRIPGSISPRRRRAA